MRLLRLILVIGVLGTAARASAQEAGSFYVIAGVGTSHQDGPSGTEYHTYPAAPGGVTTAWSAGAGVFVASAFSVEAEAAITGTMTAQEPSRDGTTFNEERRDRLVTIAGRFHVLRGGRFRVEPVVGMVVSMPQAWQQVDRYLFFGLPQQQLQIEPREEILLTPHAGVSGGADVGIGGRRLALLASIRIADTGVTRGRARAGAPQREISAIYPDGYPKWTIRPGVALRVGF